MQKFSIVIPLYNEERNIENLVKEIFLSLKYYNNSNYEIILVNDNSSDETRIVIENLKNKNPKNIKVINNKKNLGQSFSINAGIKKSIFNTIATIDGDGQNNPKDLPVLLDYFFSNKDIFLVGGIRFKRKDNFIKIISSIIANYVRNIILRDNCTDTGCSLKVFDKHIFESFPLFDGIHRFLPALFSGYGKKTFFLNVDHRHRLYGHSKYGTASRFIRGIKDIIKVVRIINNYKKTQ